LREVLTAIHAPAALQVTYQSMSQPEPGKIFRIGANPIKFHRHQAQSIVKARADQSFVVTTSTGSGKSLCFFVPAAASQRSASWLY
jgi:ATP-dependent helicase YprA (DUF1998 family)